MPDERRPFQSFFSKHAKDYSKSQSHASGPDLAALIEALNPRGTELALDAATGTGFTAVTLAGRVKHVTGIDLTEEMLGQARELAQSMGVANIEFERGDAMKTDYPDSSFDIVTTRRATHHFDDVLRFLLEAKRILKPGGRIGIVDMSPPEGAESFTNRIEKLRDGSHVEAFTPKAWESMIMGAGFGGLTSRVLDDRVTFERWLYPVEPGGKEERVIRSAWKSSPKPVRRLLKAEFDRNKIIAWSKARIVLVASKTP
jgi:ubiquinone/menaquinone biosynthesis C-methylase UbiE